MTWNYRIVEWPGGQFDVREVYHDKDGKITSWTANPREVTGESVADIIGDLELMLDCVRKRDVLHWKALPGSGQ